MTHQITLKTSEREVTFTAGPPVLQTKAEVYRGSQGVAGSWGEFVRRFDPLEIPEGGTHDFCNDYMWETGTMVQCDLAHVWTVVEGDNGEMYLCEGWHFVNRLGYIIAKNPRAVLQGEDYKVFKY